MAGEQVKARRQGHLDGFGALPRPGDVQAGGAAAFHPTAHPFDGAGRAHAVAHIAHEGPVDEAEQHRPASGVRQQPFGSLGQSAVHHHRAVQHHSAAGGRAGGQRPGGQVTQQQRHGLGPAHRRDLDHAAAGQNVTKPGGDQPHRVRAALEERLHLVAAPHVVDDEQAGVAGEQGAQVEAGLFGIGQGRAHTGQGLAEIVDPVGELRPAQRLTHRHPQQPTGKPGRDLHPLADLPGQGRLADPAGAVQHDRPGARPQFGEHGRGQGRTGNEPVRQDRHHPGRRWTCGDHRLRGRPGAGRGGDVGGHGHRGSPFGLAQLDQRVQDGGLQLPGVTETGGDDAGLPQPRAEGPLPFGVSLVDEVTEGNLGVVVQQEHQPRYPRRGRGVELELGVRHLRLPRDGGAVPKGDKPQVDIGRPHRPHAELGRVGVAGTEVLHVDDLVSGERHRPLGRRDERPLPRKAPQLGGVAQEHPPGDPLARPTHRRTDRPPRRPGR